MLSVSNTKYIHTHSTSILRIMEYKNLISCEDKKISINWLNYFHNRLQCKIYGMQTNMTNLSEISVK